MLPSEHSGIGLATDTYSSSATPLTGWLVEAGSCWKTYEFCCCRREQPNIPCPCWLLLHSRALREMGLSVQNALKGSPPSELWRHRVVDWEETISVPPETASKAETASDRRFNALPPAISPPWQDGLPLRLTLIKLTRAIMGWFTIRPKDFPKDQGGFER